VRSRFEAPAHDRVALAARRPFDEMTKGVVEPVVPAFVAAREGLRLDRIEVAPPETTFPLSLRSPVYAATAALTLPSPKGRGFHLGGFASEIARQQFQPFNGVTRCPPCFRRSK
jgi:hypothetical protein